MNKALYKEGYDQNLHMEETDMKVNGVKVRLTCFYSAFYYFTEVKYENEYTAICLSSMYKYVLTWWRDANGKSIRLNLKPSMTYMYALIQICTPKYS